MMVVHMKSMLIREAATSPNVSIGTPQIDFLDKVFLIQMMYV